MALSEGMSSAVDVTAPADVQLYGGSGEDRPPAVRADGSGPAVPHPPGSVLNDATRYLCVGAYLDEDYAKQVVDELFGQTVRAVAPSYGFDLRPVASHCLAAHRQRRRRDAFLLLVGLAMLFFAAVPVVLSGISWAMFGWVVGKLRDGFQGLWRALSGITFGSFVRGSLAVSAALVAAAMFQFIGILLIGGGALFGAVSSGGASNAQTAVGGLIGFVVLAVILAIFGWPVLFWIVLGDVISRRRSVTRRLRREAFLNQPERRTLLLPWVKARFEAVISAQYGNATVYSHYSPFVGAGDKAEGWSFAIPLVAARGHEGAVERFRVAELVAHIRRGIASIGTGVQSDDPLHGLVIGDRVFVHGLSVEGDARFVARRATAPATLLGQDEVERIAHSPHGAVRHYCAVRVESWSGEIVTSTFFHFSTDGEKLYCQWVPMVLGPVRLDYHLVDFLPAHLSLGALLRLAMDAAATTIPKVLGAPGRVITDLRGGRRPLDDIIIDYGARLSVREEASEKRDLFGAYGCHNYFQELDIDKHLKIIERQALAAMIEFLDEHGIDTTEFKSRQDQILNYGVMVMGSAHFEGPVAAGDGARASSGPGRSSRPRSSSGGAVPVQGAPQ